MSLEVKVTMFDPNNWGANVTIKDGEEVISKFNYNSDDFKSDYIEKTSEIFSLKHLAECRKQI